MSADATGANKGEPFFRQAGDVDTGAAVLTLDDSTLVLVSSTRYNGGGHDVRVEALGSAGAMAVGLDNSLAQRSAEEGVDFPPGPVHTSFMQRFHSAYRAELAAFAEVVRGDPPSPCTVEAALQAFRTAEACETSRREDVACFLRRSRRHERHSSSVLSIRSCFDEANGRSADLFPFSCHPPPAETRDLPAASKTSER